MAPVRKWRIADIGSMQEKATLLFLVRFARRPADLCRYGTRRLASFRGVCYHVMDHGNARWAAFRNEIALQP